MKCPICSADLSQHEPEITYIKEAGLADLTEEERIEYVNQIIRSIADALKRIASEKSPLVQLQLAKQLKTELEQQADTILPVILYAIKPEFRQTFLELIEALAYP